MELISGKYHFPVSDMYLQFENCQLLDFYVDFFLKGNFVSSKTKEQDINSVFT